MSYIIGSSLLNTRASPDLGEDKISFCPATVVGSLVSHPHIIFRRTSRFPIQVPAQLFFYTLRVNAPRCDVRILHSGFSQVTYSTKQASTVPVHPMLVPGCYADHESLYSLQSTLSLARFATSRTKPKITSRQPPLFQRVTAGNV